MNDDEKDKRILLVDDETDIRDVLEISLIDMGYRVFTAENGTQALESFRKGAFPIVISDIKMPGMDGIALLRRIKQENEETEVIMITGHGDMELAIKSLKYRATDFITKPINVDGLEVALKRTRDKILMREKLKEYTRNLEQLVKEKTELQDNLSSLGLMVSSISHGIKGMLAGLDGGIYLMGSGLEKDDRDRVQEGWEVIKLMSERIRKMVMDILFYAKDRALRPEKVDPAAFAGEVALVIEQRIQNENIRMVREFDSSLDDVEFDPGAVHSALVNILDNAVDACVKDGSKDSHTIRFGVARETDDLVFAVSDDGIGMTSEAKEKIFDLFYSSKGHKGTGLGLFITAKIIEQHGGRITVTSIPRRETTFHVRIPITRAES